MPREDSSSFWMVSGGTGLSPSGDKNRHSPSLSVPIGSGAAVGSHSESRSLKGVVLGPGGSVDGGIRDQDKNTLASMRSEMYSGVSHLALVISPLIMEATRV